VYSRKKKQRKKLKTINKTRAELCEYLIRLESMIKSDVETVHKDTWGLMQNDKALTKDDLTRLDWNMTHIIDGMITLTRDLKRHRKALGEPVDAY
jgi:hypothetical protein